MEIERLRYGQINLRSLTKQTRCVVARLIESAANAQHIDEHGPWTFGREFDSKRRGWAQNWDLYGVGRDHYSGKMLAVIQVRQFSRERTDYWPSIRKSYFLLGRNEDSTVFAHPVAATVVRTAIRKDRDPIKAVQRWMWGADYAKVLRQGDLGIVPVRSPKGEVIEGPVVLGESHKIEASVIQQNGGPLYALDPRATHLPGTHPDVETEGWTRIGLAKRAKTWDFAAPTID